MRRLSSFSRQCLGCGCCCHDQAIQLNPYEILCLSQYLGLDTSSFIARHTHNQGLFLGFDPGGACGFLKGRGCSVHAQRPLACRLYPLARELDDRHGESFSLCQAHPQCRAGREGQGSVAAYLAGQGVQRFVRALDLYLTLVNQVTDILKNRPGLRLEEIPGLAPGGPGRGDPWLDVDLVLAQEGAARPQAGPWERMLLHQEALRRRLAKIVAPSLEAPCPPWRKRA